MEGPKISNRKQLILSSAVIVIAALVVGGSAMSLPMLNFQITLMAISKTIPFPLIYGGIIPATKTYLSSNGTVMNITCTYNVPCNTGNITLYVGSPSDPLVHCGNGSWNATTSINNLTMVYNPLATATALADAIGCGILVLDPPTANCHATNVTCAAGTDCCSGKCNNQATPEAPVMACM